MRRNVNAKPMKPRPKKTPTRNSSQTPMPPKKAATKRVIRTYGLGERNPDTMGLESPAENRRATLRWKRIRAESTSGKYTGYGR